MTATNETPTCALCVERPSRSVSEEKDRLLRAGNTNCGGCGMSVVLTMLGRVLKEIESSCTLVIPACCGIVTAGGYPTTSYNTPVIGSTFGSCPAFGSGVAAVRDLNNDSPPVICFAGDGGTYDIGMAALSGTAERNDNLLYICYDNEIYGNTGGQRSSATPLGAKTSTSPFGKHEGKKDIIAIMAAHRIPYAATLSIAHPKDFADKLKRAISIKGFRFLLIHSPCPTGWKSEPGETVNLVRIAVNSGLFPLYEVRNGRQYRINVEPDGVTDPADYYKGQRRFTKDTIDFDTVKSRCKKNFDYLKTMAENFPYTQDA